MSDPERDVRLARKAARFYLRQGWNPLPSITHGERKQPIVKFREYWEAPIPDWWWTTRHPRYQTWNIQIMTGCRYNLVVIDLDGEEAETVWRKLSAGRPVPSTWESGRGRGSKHLWFSLPEGLEELKKRWLWIGAGKHSGIELLADRCLVVAPPSRHLVTGERYRFLEGRGPKSIPYPAELPDWVFDLEDWTTDLQPPPPPRPARSAPRRTYAGRWDSRAVLDAWSGRFHEAAQMAGFDVVSGPRRGNPFVRMRVPWAEDRVPSGGLNVNTGWFAAYGGDKRGGVSMGFANLLVAGGVVHDWRDGIAWLGARAGIQPIPA